MTTSSKTDIEYRRRVAEFFEVRARFYDTESSRQWQTGDTFRRAVSTRVEEFIRWVGASTATPVAVDVGAGTGRVYPSSLSDHVRLVALDLSPAMLTRLRGKFGADHVYPTVADGHCIPLRACTAQGLICFSALQYLDVDLAAVEFARVLMAGGLALIGSMLVDPADLSDWRNEAFRGPGLGEYLSNLPTSLIVTRAFEAAGFRLASTETVSFRRRFADMVSDKHPYSPREELERVIEVFRSAPANARDVYHIDDHGFEQTYGLFEFAQPGA